MPNILDVLQRIEEKIDRNTVVLEEHEKRSTSLEKRVEQVSVEMEPLKAHVRGWATAGKILLGALTASAAAASAAIVKYLLGG